MPNRDLITIDRQTGEILEGMPVWVGAKPISIYGHRWFQMSQDPLLQIAKDKELAGRPMRVLVYLLARLDFENYIQVPQAEIAEELELHRTSVSSVISLLEKKGILIRGPKVGRSFAFRLNPAYGWKGKTKNAREAQQEAIKAQLEVIQGGKPE